jgi:polysaccharide export outer membrane protein
VSALFLATGCETPNSGTRTNATAATPTNLISIDKVYVGDQIRVVMDAPAPIPPTETTVPESGTITIHMGERIQVAGRRTEDIAQEITQIFTEKKQVFRPGRLTVTVQVYGRSVSVGGDVRNTGSFPFEGGMTVLKAINRAGGFTEWADRTEVQVTRLNGQQLTVDCKAAVRKPSLDLPLFPGDRIHVPRKIL